MIEKLNRTLKNIVGEKHEVTDSIREALKERLTSPFYGYFIISWILVNWDYIYSALFVNGDLIFQKTNLLKDEYLLQKVLPTQYSLWSYWLDFLILPFILTIIAFWLLPYVIRFFYKKHIRNKIELEEIKAQEMAAEKRAETEVLKAEVEKAEVEDRVEKTNPEILWRDEFSDFQRHKLYKQFQKIIDSVYNYSGEISLSRSHGQIADFDISQEMLVYADVNNLITRKESNKIELTQKGKLYVKLFTQE